ncbi:GDSL-type esterase/lipase family protein [Zavarzinella formosa]|uniref:GDSL-type esterase/lipase family protein n=1 Tax=Zavarzinella formosa TaxID=360055 RepID=UPI0003641A53|nr:GDSL-type esterase/lipase family protein [Zavarzinella formosa]
MNKRILLAAAMLMAFVPQAGAQTAVPVGFPLKDGDVWVMAGDSITAQHLHSNYFEAFCYARYPKLKFAFRNSGVGGHTIPSTMARFDWDIAVWKPTVVSVELGMNDQGGTPTDKYIANMGDFDAMIRKAGARPVYFTASPINNGSTMKNISGNAKLNDYAIALKKFAEGKNAPFADQFHQLVDVWGNNKPNENLLTALGTIRSLAQNDKVEGVEHLKDFLAVQAKSKKILYSMTGDPVHPGTPGQLTMAAALLKELGAEPFVSSVVLDSKGQVTEAKGCKVEAGKEDGGTISFTRTDDCAGFPIPDDARSMLTFYPVILELSQHTLAVKGLKGNYNLAINGLAVGTVSGEELEKGVNLTTFAKGAIADQGKAILNAVGSKENLVGQVRGQSKAAIAPGVDANVKAKFDALLKQVEAADEKIREAAKPKAMKFDLIPAK